MSPGLKSKSIKGVLWASGESLGVATVSFASFVVIAHKLQPQDFGLMAMATVFIYFFNLFTGHTFADALVQRQDIDQTHLDTAFWSTLAAALGLMALCLVGADWISALLKEPNLAPVLRWLSLCLPLSALSSVQLAQMRRDMQFSAVAVRNVSGRLAGVVAGIAMALTGWGVWSLVGQQLVGVAVTSAAFMATPWRPRFRYSGRHFHELWTFGYHVSANQIVTGAGEQAMNLVIGALFGSTTLGYFSVAWRMVTVVKSLISSAVYYVGLSAFSKLQGDVPAMTRAFLQSTRLSCLIGFPMAVGMAVVGGPLTTALFGSKWDQSIPLLTVLALDLAPSFYGMFLSSLYRAAGKPAWGLYMSFVYLGVGLTGILLITPLGIMAASIFWVVRSVAMLPVHVFLLRKLLHAPMSAFAQPMMAPLMASLIMGAGILGLRFAAAGVDVNPVVLLAITVPVGVLIYAGSIWALSRELANTALRTARMMAGRSSPSSAL